MNQSSPESLLTPKEVSEILGVTEHTLAVWRCENRYPLPYIKVGRYIRYRSKDLSTFLDNQTVQGGYDA